MDHGHDFTAPRSASFSRISSAHSSFRRLSFNLSGAGDHEVDEDSVSEAGDIGDRALNSKRYGGSGRCRSSFENLGENLVVPIQENSLKESQLPTASPASPDAILQEKDENKVGFPSTKCFSHNLLSLIECMLVICGIFF